MYRAHKTLATVLTGVALMLIATGSLVVAPQIARADKGAAFIGGLIGGHVLTNVAHRSERRTQAGEYQAYSQQPAPAPAAVAPSSQSSVQDRLDTLDTLAANGTITKEEYQQRRKAILDSL